jgi:hypothetical protein
MGLDHACAVYLILSREPNPLSVAKVRTSSRSYKVPILIYLSFPTLHILNNANINRYSPNDTAQDGTEAVGKRIVDPSVSNIKDNCLETNATGYGCYPEIAHNKSEPLS